MFSSLRTLKYQMLNRYSKIDDVTIFIQTSRGKIRLSWLDFWLEITCIFWHLLRLKEIDVGDGKAG